MLYMKIDSDIRSFSQQYFKKNTNLIRSVHNLGTKYQVAGLIGECTAKKGVGLPWVVIGDNRDAGYDFCFCKQRIDVKTQMRTLPVKNYYNVGVDVRQIKNPCDIYLFCSVDKVFEFIEYCGWLPKDEFIEKSVIMRAGDVVEKSNGDVHTFKTDCYLTKVSELNEFNFFSQFKRQVEEWQKSQY